MFPIDETSITLYLNSHAAIYDFRLNSYTAEGTGCADGLLTTYVESTIGYEDLFTHHPDTNRIDITPNAVPSSTDFSYTIRVRVEETTRNFVLAFYKIVVEV